MAGPGPPLGNPLRVARLDLPSGCWLPEALKVGDSLKRERDFGVCAQRPTDLRGIHSLHFLMRKSSACSANILRISNFRDIAKRPGGKFSTG